MAGTSAVASLRRGLPAGSFSIPDLHAKLIVQRHRKPWPSGGRGHWLMKPVSIRFLGRFELQSPSGGRDLVSGAKTVLLLARLALPPGQIHDRKRLTELLWPDRGEVQALASLRQSLWSLRKALGQGALPPIIAERTSIRLDPAVVEVDAVEFERQIRSDKQADLERAIALYRGDFLEEFDLDDDEGYQPFLFERRRLRGMALSGLKTLAGLRARAGDPDGAVEVAQRALSFDPLQEDVHAMIMRLHRDNGRLGLARDQYEACRDLLRRELGVAPSEEMEALRNSLGARPIIGAAPENAVLVLASPAPSPRPAPTQPDRLPLSVSRLALLLSGVATVAALTLLYLFQTTGMGTALASRPAASDTRPSLVVLPFEDISVDNQQAEFAAGLTDDLITDLSKVSALFVIAPETSRSMQDPAVSAREVAETLGVDYAVKGTLRRSRGMIRVTAQLVEAGTGRAVWAERYDRQATDLFDVQDDVIQHIVTSLQIELSDQERRTITRIPTDNFEAHDFYLRAEYQNVGMTEPKNLSRSIAAYRRAIDLDPDFAEAHAGYARVAVTIWRRDFSDIMTSAMAKEEAYASAGRALELDPENARAYEVLSLIQAVEGEHQIAVTSARKAVDLQPNDAEAHTNLAQVLYIAGDLDAAQASVAIAQRLNPALPTELRLVSATVAFAQGRYADAVAEFNAVREDVPRMELVLEHLAAAYAYLDETEKARAVAAELQEVLPITNLGYYSVLRQNIGTPEQNAHFIDGLRRAGIPEWPYGDQRQPEDRLDADELRAVVAGPLWTGKLENGVDFMQYFDPAGNFAYRSTSSLLSGRVEIDGDRLCQVIDGYLMNHPTCGYVYRNVSGADHPEQAFAYVSIDAVKYFSVSD